MATKIDQNYTYISERIIRALEFAARAHDGQFRKDAAKTPYFSHPAGVGLILVKIGCAEDVIIAGILHDVIEDTKHTYEEIAEEFGSDVAELVKWVSIPDHVKGIEGKKIYVENLANAPKEALLVSAADMLYNRADIILGKNTGNDILHKFAVPSYMNSELNDRRIDIIAIGLGEDHLLVKDLRDQQEIFKTF